MQPERMAAVLAQDADLIIRAGWKSVRWCDVDGTPLDLIAVLGKARKVGRVDRSIGIAPKSGELLRLRLVAIRKPAEAATAARAKATREAQRGGHQLTSATLIAADWVILVTSLEAAEYSADSRASSD